MLSLKKSILFSLLLCVGSAQLSAAPRYGVKGRSAVKLAATPAVSSSAGSVPAPVSGSWSMPAKVGFGVLGVAAAAAIGWGAWKVSDWYNTEYGPGSIYRINEFLKSSDYLFNFELNEVVFPNNAAINFASIEQRNSVKGLLCLAAAGGKLQRWDTTEDGLVKIVSKESSIILDRVVTGLNAEIRLLGTKIQTIHDRHLVRKAGDAQKTLNVIATEKLTAEKIATAAEKAVAVPDRVVREFSTASKRLGKIRPVGDDFDINKDINQVSIEEWKGIKTAFCAQYDGDYRMEAAELLCKVTYRLGRAIALRTLVQALILEHAVARWATGYYLQAMRLGVGNDAFLPLANGALRYYRFLHSEVEPGDVDVTRVVAEARRRAAEAEARRRAAEAVSAARL